MQVINNSKAGDTRFDSIKWGACFIWSDATYIRIKGTIEAVRLSDGEPCTFAVGDLVQPVDAKVIIT